MVAQPAAPTLDHLIEAAVERAVERVLARRSGVSVEADPLAGLPNAVPIGEAARILGVPYSTATDQARQSKRFMGMVVHQTGQRSYVAKASLRRVMNGEAA